MEKATCYYCNKDFPKSQIKRCSRCRLVTYCSKECQTYSWKASHKSSCVVHPSLLDPDDPTQTRGLTSKVDKPEKFSEAWVELKVDEILSKWMQLWRHLFQRWTLIALDLANHPPDRVITHCMLLTVEPRHFEDNPAKQYIVVDARVEALSVILEKAPDLLRKPIDPTELDRLRFVLILQTPTGGVRRMRMVQWNDSAIQRFREVDKEGSRLLSEGFAEALMWSVQESTPRQCEKNLGISRRR